MGSIIFPELLSAQMHDYDWGPGMSGWGFHTGWLWQPIMMVVLFVVIVLGIYFLVRWKPPQSGPGQETALDILKKRYARGEISKEEFEEKKRHIES